ncbi:MAG: hypothetical protein ACW96X_02755 [Promethearchaeota archaeon]
MTIDTDRVDRTSRDYTKFLPLVYTRKGKSIFVPGFIYQSLLKETDLPKIDAKKVTEHVTRFLISANLKLITAPLIREVVNVHLLKLGFEKARLQYTRIGIPFYDLQRLFNNKKNMGFRSVVVKIIKWIISEFKAVGNLIKSYP